MLKNLILIFSVIAIMYSPLVAQNSQNAHQLTQSSFVAIDGKVIVSPGGKYTSAETEQVFLRDSLISGVYDTVNNLFKNNKSKVFDYDSGGLLTTSVSKTVDKNGISWSNNQQVIYKYTGFQLFEETFKSWDKTLTNWVNFLNYKYSYDSQNSLTNIFYQAWDATNTTWNYSTKDLLAYDANNKLITITNQKWNKNLASWDNYLRINFTYSGGYIVEKTNQVWNKTSLLWEDYQKETFTYASNEKSEVMVQTKTPSTSWENYSRSTYAYENSLLSTSTEYLWYNSWIENRKYNYTYNSNNLETKVITQLWAAHLGIFRNQGQDESYYTQREVIGISENPASLIMIANPLSKNSPFQVQGLKENTKYTLKLITLDGKTLRELPVRSGQDIQLQGQIRNGIYLIGLSAPGIKSKYQKVYITD